MSSFIQTIRFTELNRSLTIELGQRLIRYGVYLSSLKNIATILLFAQIRGDALQNPNLGYALALGMIVITSVSNGGYIWLRSRSEKWLR